MLVALCRAISTKDVRYTDCSTSLVLAACCQSGKKNAFSIEPGGSFPSEETDETQQNQRKGTRHEFVVYEGGFVFEGSILLLSMSDQPGDRLRQSLAVHLIDLIHRSQSLHHRGCQPDRQHRGTTQHGQQCLSMFTVPVNNKYNMVRCCCSLSDH